jgi:hypothetical protein
MFLIIFCAAMAMLAIIVVSVLLQKISSIVLTLFLIAAMFLFFYLIVGISLVFFIQIFEGSGFFEAAFRSLQLVRGKWWSTFGLYFILSAIGVAISYIFLIPFYVFVAITAYHNGSAGKMTEVTSTLSFVTYIFFAVYFSLQMLLQMLPQIGLVFQYFNLVEMKEARGLLNDIENFGKPPSEPPMQESF